MCVHAKSLQLCPTLCNLKDYNPPGSSVHGILQAKILEWVAVASSRELSHAGIKPMSLMSPALAAGFSTTTPGKPLNQVDNTGTSRVNFSSAKLTPNLALFVTRGVDFVGGGKGCTGAASLCWSTRSNGLCLPQSLHSAT